MLIRLIFINSTRIHTEIYIIHTEKCNRRMNAKNSSDFQGNFSFFRYIIHWLSFMTRSCGTLKQVENLLPLSRMIFSFFLKKKWIKENFLCEVLLRKKKIKLKSARKPIYSYHHENWIKIAFYTNYFRMTIIKRWDWGDFHRILTIFMLFMLFLRPRLFLDCNFIMIYYNLDE